MSEQIVERRTVRCAHCGDTFSYVFRVTPEELQEDRIVAKMTCPFPGCKRKLSVDLAKSKRNFITGTRGGVDNAPSSSDVLSLNLPAELQADLDED